MPRLSILAVALVGGLLASCQSMSQGLIGLEGRATIYDDQSFDAAGSSDVDVSAYGLQMSVNTPILDVLAGVDVREYGDSDTEEFQLGVRRRFFELWRVHPFVEANLRYGLDLDTGTTSDGYTGYNLGGGLMFDLTDSIFLTARVLWETAELATPGGDVTTDGVVGMIGIGINF